MNVKSMTQTQALADGYLYCCKDNDEITELLGIMDCPFDADYVLLGKKSYPVTVGEDTIRELLVDYMANQDEVADEDGELCDLVATVDYSDISKKVNEVLSVKKYWHSTNIKLIKDI